MYPGVLKYYIKYKYYVVRHYPSSSLYLKCRPVSLSKLALSDLVLPEDGDRIQFPKYCVLKEKQEDSLNKEKTIDNVQKHKISTNLPSSQTFR
jgi:hypothetical protein